MAIKCPNKNTKEWRKLVKALGETSAYDAYIRNGEEIPDYSTHPLYDKIKKEFGVDAAINAVYRNQDLTEDNYKQFVPVTHETFDTLVEKTGRSYESIQRIMDKYSSLPADKKIDTRNAVEFLSERFPNASVEFSETPIRVGSELGHGAFKNMAFYLWNHAEVGTEYHEAFHGLTQMYYTPQQLSSLYDDATSVYEGLDRANELGLEEQLAEDFREYMLMQEEASIPQKIKEWFKGLYYYLKALITDGTTIDQAFTMLSQNRIPPKMKRNVSQFQSENVLLSTIPRALQKDVLDGIFYKYSEIADSLGAKEDIDSAELHERSLQLTREWFIENAYSDENRDPIDPNTAITLARMKEDKNVTDEQYIEALEEFNVWEEPPMSTLQDLGLTKLEMDDADLIGDSYTDIYLNWTDTPVERKKEDGSTEKITGNFTHSGWKTKFEESLSDYGYQVVEEQVLEDDIIQERIYNRSHIEESLKNKLSGEVKRFFMNINTGGRTFTGLPQKKRFDEIFADVLNTVYDARSINEMIERLRDEVEFKPYLQDVVDKLDAKDNRFKSKLWFNLASTYNKLFQIKTFIDRKDYKTGPVTFQNIAIFESNQNAIHQKIIHGWQGRAFANEVTDSGKSIYIKDIQSSSIKVNRPNANKVAKSYKKIAEFLNSNEQEITDEVFENLEQLTKNLGFYGDENVIPWFKTYFNEGRKVEGELLQGKDLLVDFRDKLEPLLRNIFDITVEKRQPQLEIKEEPSNFFADTAGKISLRRFADIQAKYGTHATMSYNNAENKLVYPINMRTQLSDVFREIQNDEYFTEGFLKDKMFNPINGEKSKQHRSLYWQLLDTSQEVKDNFISRIFDASHNSKSDTKTTYRDQSQKQILTNRINSFYNSNRDFAHFYLPTEAGRPRWDAYQMVKLDKLADYGLSHMSVENIIRNELISQIGKIQQAREFINNFDQEWWIEDYHFKYDEKGNKSTKLGNAFKLSGILAPTDGTTGLKMVGNTRTDQIDFQSYVDGILDDSLSAQIDQAIESYISDFNEKIDGYTNDVVAKLKELEIVQDVAHPLKADNPFDSAVSRNYSSLEEFIRDYTLNSVIHKNEITKLLRNSTDFFSDYANFSKRMGLITTPGYVHVLQGDLDPNWGLPQTLKEATIADVYDTNADSSLYDWLKSPEINAPFAEDYKPGASNKTDAQGFISIDLWKGLKQAQGEWYVKDEGKGSHEQAYKNYHSRERGNKYAGQFRDDNGKFPPINPEKPFYDALVEHGIGSEAIMAPVSIKSFYIPLLKEFTNHKGSPLKRYDDLRKRMEKEGEYSDQWRTETDQSTLEDLHMVHVVSAKKMTKNAVFDLNEAGKLDTIHVNDLPGKYFRVPQVKPDTKKASIRLGSQLMRLIMSRIAVADEYDVAGEVLTRDQLEERYHSIVTDMLENDLTNLKKEIKYEDYINDPTNKELQKEIHMKLRDMLIESSKSSNRPLSDNQKKALDVKLDQTGNYTFKLPLSFPAFARKNEQLLFSIFRNRVMDQFTKGKQVVQIAELGGVLKQTENEGVIEETLRFINIDGSTTTEAKIGQIQKTEIAVSRDIADMFNIKEGDDLSRLSEEAKSFIGYRIPTQGKNSMLPMVVKRILPDNFKSMIMVPGRITTQMGSDFDIDSLFLMIPHTKRGKDGSIQRIKYNEGRDKKTREQLENGLLEIVESILTNREHALEMLRPLEKGQLEDKIKEGIEKNFDPNHPLTETDLQLMNADGSMGIAIHANFLMGYVTTQHMEIPIAEDRRIKYINEKGKPVELGIWSPLKDRSGNYVEFNISEHMTIALENEKEPAMKVINDNAFTSPVTHFMLGSGLSIIDAYNFRTNVHVRNLTDAYQNGEYTPGRLKELIEELLGESAKQTVTPMDYSNVGNHSQKEILSNFLIFHKAGQDSSKLHNVVTPNRISDMSSNAGLAQFKDAEDYIRGRANKTFIINSIQELDDKFPLNKAYRKVIDETIKFSNLFFPHQTDMIKDFKNDLLDDIGSTGLNTDLHKQYNDFLFTYMFTIDKSKPGEAKKLKKIGDIFEGSRIYNLLFTKNNIVNKYFKTLEEFPQLKDNAFISALNPHRLNANEAVQRLDFENNYGYSKQEIDIITNGFLELYDNKATKEFARDLLHYSILTTGFSPTAESFVENIPIEVWEAEGLSNTFVKEHNKIINNNADVEYNNLNHEFILHNVQRNNFLYSVQLKKGEHKKKSFFKAYDVANTLGLRDSQGNFKKYIRAYNPDTSRFDLYVYNGHKTDRGYEGVEYKKSQQKGIPFQFVEPNVTRDGQAIGQSLHPTNREDADAFYYPDKYDFADNSQEQFFEEHEKAKSQIKPKVVEELRGKPFQQKSSRLSGLKTPETKLLETFQNAGIDVTVEIDSSIEGLGEVEISSQRSEYLLNTPVNIKSIYNKLPKNVKDFIPAAADDILFKYEDGQFNMYEIHNRLEIEEYTSIDDQGRIVDDFKEVPVTDIELVSEDVAGSILQEIFKDKSLPKKATIKLQNEQLRGADTEIHEFGHIYVELLGYDSDIVQQGINQLRGGKLWNEIAELYDNLNEKDLAKEVLVTAIGEEGATYLNQPWWKAWWNRMLNRLKDLFGIERSVAQQLATEMLNNDLRPFNSKFLNDNTFQHRKEKKAEKSRNMVKDILVALRKQQIDTQNMLELETVTARKEMLIRKIQNLEKQQNVAETEIAAVQDYIKDAHKDAMYIEQNLERYRQGETDPNFMSKASYILSTLKDHEAINQIHKAIENYDIDGDYHEKLDTTVRILKHSEEDVVDILIPKMTNFLLPEINPQLEKQIQEMIDNVDETGHIPNPREVKRSEEYQIYRDRYKLTQQGKEGGITKEEFKEYQKEISKKILKRAIPNRTFIEHALRNAVNGSGYAYMLDPLIYSNDQIVALFSSIVKDQLINAHDQTLRDRDMLDKAYKEFTKATGSSDWNNERKYDKLLNTVKNRLKRPDGSYKIINQLEFVQPYDMNKWNSELYSEIERLEEKYRVPQDLQERNEWKLNQEEEYRSFMAEQNSWRQRHTVPKEGWEKIVQEYQNEQGQLEEEKRKLERELIAKDANVSDINNKLESVETRLLKVNDWLESNLNSSGTPVGELRRPSDEYKSVKWEELNKPENAAHKKFYDTMLDYYQKLQKQYGTHNFKVNPWDEYNYMIPTIRKNDMDRFLEDGIVDFAKEKTYKDLSILETDDVYGQYQGHGKQVPIYFSNPVDESEVSRDISSSLLVFGKQAHQFTELTHLVGHVNVLSHILENRNVPEYNSKGQKIRDSIHAYYDSHKEITSQRDPKEVESYKQFQAFIDNVFYGIKDIKSDWTIPIIGKTVERNKLVRQINSYSAWLVFPFNVFQGGANIFTGNNYILQEAMSKQFFGTNDYVKSLAFLTKQTPGLLNDIGKTTPDSLLGKLIEHFDMQEGRITSEIGLGKFNTLAKNRTKADLAFMLQKGGELELAISPFLSKLNAIKAKDSNGEVITNGEGKPMSILDAYSIDQNGDLKLDSRVANFSTKDRHQVMKQIHGLNRSMQGVYDQFNQPAIKRTWWGKLLSLFRSWMLPNFRRFWGYEGGGMFVDHEMGIVKEGIYQSGFRWVRNFLTDPNYKFSMDAYRTMTPMERHNVMRFYTHMGAYFGAMGVIAMLRPGDDEDEIDPSRYYALYYSRRLQSELGFFMNPAEWSRIIKSPMAAQLVSTRILRFGTALTNDGINLLTGEDFERYQRRAGVWEKGDSKLYARFRDLLPVLNNIDRAKNPEDAYNFFQNLTF